MSKTPKELLDFMQKPESYPHKPARVRHIQTHISHVFMASPFVFKIKKPVDFGFLDYSTLQKREHFCEREVALNRRLCSEIYLGVIPITQDEDSFSLHDEARGEVVEYAVKMKELDDKYFLHNYIEEGRLGSRILERVAEKLTRFYQVQEPSREVLKYGEISQIRFNTEENFSQTEEFIGTTIAETTYKGITYFTESYLSHHADLFERRIQEKRIVDGHGDLHLEHIHIRPDQLCIYDCIEFNERFRCGDQAVDLAFLAMDLDFQECWKEERYFMDLMAEKLEDPELHLITDFYKCYRAYVKGKVKSLQSAEEEVEAKDRERAAALARKYFGLSLRYALLGSQPWVLIFMGGVGTGKSTLASSFSDVLGIEAYSSDRIRKAIAGIPLDKRTPPSQREKVYSSSMSKQTYDRLMQEAREHVGRGRSVILDATYSKKESRAELEKYLESAGINYLFIEAQASEETVKERLRSRDTETEVVSDARLGDYSMLEARYETPNEVDPQRIINLTTDRKLSETLMDLYRKMIDLQF